jgi:hypothetical protein
VIYYATHEAYPPVHPPEPLPSAELEPQLVINGCRGHRTDGLRKRIGFRVNMQIAAIEEERWQSSSAQMRCGRSSAC